MLQVEGEDETGSVGVAEDAGAGETRAVVETIGLPEAGSRARLS